MRGLLFNHNFLTLSNVPLITNKLTTNEYRAIPWFARPCKLIVSVVPGDPSLLDMAPSEHHGVGHQAVPVHQARGLVHAGLYLGEVDQCRDSTPMTSNKYSLLSATNPFVSRQNN